jgi:uncharacterized membrane protein YfcA
MKAMVTGRKEGEKGFCTSPVPIEYAGIQLGGSLLPLILWFPTRSKRKIFMDGTSVAIIASGVLVGMGASFTGLGGGFLMVPLLLFLGFTAQKAVGTSFVGILVIAVSALIAHGRMAHVDYKYGLLLGLGGIIGAQIGARLVEGVPTDMFKKIFAVILIGLAIYLFVKK